MFSGLLPTLLLLGTLAFAWGQAGPEPRLLSVARQPDGWVRIRGDAAAGETAGWMSTPPSRRITLEASTNLQNWRTIACLHDNRFTFLDPGAGEEPCRFYRFSTTPIDETNDWKKQILFLGLEDSRIFWEYFYGYGGGPFQYAKFVIPADDPTRVFYSHSSRYLFHYDFASTQLEPFVGISPGEFERITRYNEGRRLYIGSVLTGFSGYEFGIQFDAADPLPGETVCQLFKLVASTVIDRRATNTTPAQAYYIPAYDQLHAATAQADIFASNHIPVATLERWTSADIIYASGWHLGRLKYVPATNIAAAYASGELEPDDILLTDSIPAELPYVSGILTLTPATPNSHVAILARSYGIPFAYIHSPADRERALALDGKYVGFRSAESSADIYHRIVKVFSTVRSVRNWQGKFSRSKPTLPS